jgi:hypothetical protein
MTTQKDSALSAASPDWMKQQSPTHTPYQLPQASQVIENTQKHQAAIAQIMLARTVKTSLLFEKCVECSVKKTYTTHSTIAGKCLLGTAPTYFLLCCKTPSLSPLAVISLLCYSSALQFVVIRAIHTLLLWCWKEPIGGESSGQCAGQVRPYKRHRAAPA